jgi:hypothetical protein
MFKGVLKVTFKYKESFKLKELKIKKIKNFLIKKQTKNPI